MENKHNISNVLNLIYIQYILVIINPLQIIVSHFSSLVSGDIYNFITSISIGSDPAFILFQLFFLGMLFLSIKNNGKNIEEDNDEEKAKLIEEKLIPYKIFISANIALSIVTIILTKDLSLVVHNTLVVLVSVVIYLGKEIYFKSYIYDRKRVWLEKIGDIDSKEINMDTKSWRYKLWRSDIVKVPFEHRRGEVIYNFVGSLLYGVMLFYNPAKILNILLIYIFVKCLLGLFENIFSLYTTLDGTCTGIYEKRYKNDIDYRMVVTDYNNKREIVVKTKSTYHIQSMVNVSVVHGIFTKKTMLLNNVKTEYIKYNNIPITVVLLLTIMPSVVNKINIENNSYKDINTNYSTQSYSTTDEVGSYDSNNNDISGSMLNDAKVIEINEQANYNNVYVRIDKVEVSDTHTKIYYRVTNLNSEALALNVSYETKIKGSDVYCSNILLPSANYTLETEHYDKDALNKESITLNLEYELSQDATDSFDSYNRNLYYPVIEIDKDCTIYIDLLNETCDISFNTYETPKLSSTDTILFN